MTKYIPHIHPHRFPTAKIRTFRHTAVSHFTPILSQITAIKTTRAAPPSGGAALILSVSESDCLFSLRFRRGLVLFRNIVFIQRCSKPFPFGQAGRPSCGSAGIAGRFSPGRRCSTAPLSTGSPPAAAPAPR